MTHDIQTDTFTHAPLFAGINGFGIAAEAMGWHQPFHCEIDEFCQTLIQYYWPKSKAYHDIRETDFTIWRGKIGILSGGFPCQPFSVAGSRGGTNDGRYLWPEYLRAIRESKPNAIVGENVTGIISMAEQEVFAKVESGGVIRYQDLDNYQAVYSQQKDMLVNNICEDIEGAGYKIQPFVIPAASIGAPHRRERIWFVAYTEDFQWDQEWKESQQCGTRGNAFGGIDRIDGEGAFTYTEGERLEGQRNEGTGRPTGEGIDQGRRLAGSICETWQDFPTEHPVCSGNDGISEKLDGITFSDWYKKSITGYGNAVVPDVALQIFQAVELELQKVNG